MIAFSITKESSLTRGSIGSGRGTVLKNAVLGKLYDYRMDAIIIIIISGLTYTWCTLT